MYSSGSTASLAKPTDGVVSRLINRRISLRISLLLARCCPPSPDLVSVVAAALVGLAGPLYASGHSIAAGLAAQLGAILDGVDGEIARLTGRASKAGAILDTYLDRLADIALLAGMALAALAQLGNPPLAAWLTALAVSGDMIVTYIHAYIEKTLGRHPALIGRIPNIAGRDTRLFIAFLAGLASNPVAGLAAIAALGHAYAAAKTLEALREAEKEASTATS